MKALLVMAAMLAASAAVAGDVGTERIPQGKILSYGIYRVPGGVRIPTDRVPLKLGRIFGIEFSVFGLPYEEVEIICRARHPQTVPGGEGINSEDAFARKLVTRHGRLSEPFYRVWLRRESMQIEGTWTLFCSYGEQVLVSKDFHLHRPE